MAVDPAAGEAQRVRVATLLKRRGRRAGIGMIHPHQLRHTFANAWLSASRNEGDLVPGRVAGEGHAPALRRRRRPGSRARASSTRPRPAWWKEERGRRVFVDFNQNAPHKTVFGAWCVRARPGAQVSTPFHWHELDDAFHPDRLTMPVVVDRVARDGDPWTGMYERPQSIEPLLAMYDRDLANGLMDAPWPPVYPKQPNEPPRVAPTRAKKAPSDERGR